MNTSEVRPLDVLKGLPSQVPRCHRRHGRAVQRRTPPPGSCGTSQPVVLAEEPARSDAADRNMQFSDLVATEWVKRDGG